MTRPLRVLEPGRKRQPRYALADVIAFVLIVLAVAATLYAIASALGWMQT